MPGTYTLPRCIAERLEAAGAAADAIRLATFLARYWSSPRKLGQGFPADRRRLAELPALGLSEARIRKALRILELLGFLERCDAIGSAYQRTVDGPHRKPIIFRFSESFVAQFKAVHCLFAKRRRQESQAPSVEPTCTPRQQTHKHPVSTGPMLMGLQPAEPEPNQGLEAALARLGAALFSTLRPE